MRTFIALAVIAGHAVALGNICHAAPITTNTALPVAKGEYVFREQWVLDQSGNDASAANRDHQGVFSSSVLGYGITADLALFGVLPLGLKRLDLTLGGARVRRDTAGIGDAQLFTRYTVYKRDMPGETFRVAPFVGAELPTGANTKRDALGRLPPLVQPGSGSWDPFGGLVVTYQTRAFQIDVQASYQANTEADGFEFGDVARLDGSLQYRLWPRELTELTPGFLYGVLEANLIHVDKSQVNGLSDPNSGGTTLWGLVGLQYVTSRSIVEAGVQLPLVQDLNGIALERGYILRAGFRKNF